MCGIELERGKKEWRMERTSARETQGCLSFPSILNRDSRDGIHKPHAHTHTDRSIFRGTISQALITVSYSVLIWFAKFAHIHRTFTNPEIHARTQLHVHTHILI